MVSRERSGKYSRFTALYTLHARRPRFSVTPPASMLATTIGRYPAASSDFRARELVRHADREIRIKASVLLKVGSIVEYRLVRYGHAPAELLLAVGNAKRVENAPAGIDPVDSTRHKIQPAIHDPDGMVHHGGIGKRVAGVQEVDPGTRRNAQPLVEGVADASIRLADPIVDCTLVPADHVHRAIRGASVNHDVLNVIVTLPQDACYRRRDIRAWFRTTVTTVINGFPGRGSLK